MVEPTSSAANIEEAVRNRYSGGARRCDDALCCPVQYDGRLLEVIPAEVIERDYGCGDPTRYVRAGETVVDLGSGSGKACFIASQVVGPEGRVLGVDMNEDMLALARRHAPAVAERIGYANVEFLEAKIQDLRAVAADSVDVVMSNCVLNLVAPEARVPMFQEIFRVLKPGGRAVVADIVCDRDVPESLQRDPELWSGCISGAFREDRFLAAFEDAGFAQVVYDERQAQPWRVVEGIEFRSATVIARKPGATTSAGCGPSGGCC